jgi:peptidoglycan/LPS O-acetylase OafA/YrhL
LLSGYVIGLTNTEKFSSQRAAQYLTRRGIRLIPIYWIVVSLSVIVSPRDNMPTILGNLFFLQVFAVPVLQSNPILWTLNYEVIYYFIFLLIWLIRPRVITLVFGSLAISTVGWFMPQLPQLIPSYAAGGIFWLLGLWLVWKVDPSPTNSNKFPLVSYFLLLLATNNLNTGLIILKGLGFPNSAPGAVNLSDLALLPICLVIFSEVTHRRFRGYKWLRLICFFIPVMNILFLLSIGRLFENYSWIASAIFTVLAIALLPIRNSTNILFKLAPIGRISYAFYILHMPMMKLVHDYFPYQGTIWSFSLRLLVWFLITIGVSMLLELVMQPAVKRKLYQRFYPNKV